MATGPGQAAIAKTRHSGRVCRGRRKAMPLGPTERRAKGRHRERRQWPASSWPVAARSARRRPRRRKGGWMDATTGDAGNRGVGGDGGPRGRGGPDWHNLLDRSNHHLDQAEVLLQRSKNGIWEARRKCRDWTSYRVIHEVSWGRLVAAGDFWAGDWSGSAGRAGSQCELASSGQLGGWLVRSTFRAQASR